MDLRDSLTEPPPPPAAATRLAQARSLLADPAPERQPAWPTLLAAAAAALAATAAAAAVILGAPAMGAPSPLTLPAVSHLVG